MRNFKDFITEWRGSYLRINPDTHLLRKRRHVDSMLTNSNVKPVPKCHQSNNNAVQPFEELKRANSGEREIIHAHANKLAQQFGFNLPAQENEEKACGNTGIRMKRSVKNGWYTLTK